MKGFLAFCVSLAFLAFLADPVDAGSTVLLTDAGYFLVTTDSAGVPQTPVKVQVVDVRDGATPAPNPTPTPPAATPIAKRSTDAAIKVNDPNGAMILAGVYRWLIDQDLSPDKFAGDSSMLKMASDTALAKYEKESGRAGAAAAWKTYRSEVTAILGEQKSQGLLETQQDYDRILTQLADGLDNSHPGALTPIEVKAWLDLILPLLFELLRLFGGVGGGGIPG